MVFLYYIVIKDLVGFCFKDDFIYEDGVDVIILKFRLKVKMRMFDCVYDLVNYMYFQLGCGYVLMVVRFVFFDIQLILVSVIFVIKKLMYN